MRDLDGRRSLNELVALALDRLGGIASAADIVAEFKRTASYDEFTYYAERAIFPLVRQALRTKDVTGLPTAYSVDNEYMPPRLFSVEQFEKKAVKFAELADQNKAKVYLLETTCAEVHNGTTFDARAILRMHGLAS